MQVHEIHVRRENESFVVSAEKREPLRGMSVVGHNLEAIDFYRPEKVEMVLESPEDVVTTIGRLLRDGVE